MNGQVSNFVYDANNQLTKETIPDGTINTYACDEVGNRKASDLNGNPVMNVEPNGKKLGKMRGIIQSVFL